MSLILPERSALAQLGARLRAGGLVGMATETVYGLAGDATSAAAVAAIYAAKGRPQFNPLIIHVRDLEDAMGHGVLDARAQALAGRFWPGPLTLVVPRRTKSPVAELACAGLATIALRAPAHPVARDLIAAAGRPLAAPSANISGAVSPTTAAHVREAFGEDVPVLDGGACAAGLESTIVAILPGEPARLLRPGALARLAIESVTGALAAARDGVMAPGMLSSHYAPRAALRLDAESPAPGEAFLGFGAACHSGWPTLSALGDLQEAAANLYAMVRALDAAGHTRIAVAPIPRTGLGEAINDRLTRAAR